MQRLALVLLLLSSVIAHTALASPSEEEVAGCTHTVDGGAGAHVSYGTDQADRLKVIEPSCALAMQGAGLIADNRTAEGELAFVQALSSAPSDLIRGFVRHTAAQAYFARAQGHDDKQEWQQSIADYTVAHGYSPDDVGILGARAVAYERALDMPAAIADFTAVIEQGDDDPQGFQSRGVAREMNLDFDGAIRDFDEALRLGGDVPSSAQVYHLRGRALAVLGRLDLARADLEKAMALEPAGSTVVWLHIVHLKFGENDSDWLAQRYAAMHHDTWQAQVVAYFTGTTSADALIRFAQTDAGTAQAYQRCDAWFYLGEDALSRGDTARASELFHETISRCDALDYEWDVAHIELKNLVQ